MSEVEDAVDATDELAPLTDAIAATLPSGWRLETLGSLCEKSQYGWTTKADKDGQGVKFLRTTDITPGVVDWDRVPFCVEEPPDLEKYLIREGDLLISRTGSIGVNYLVNNPEPAVFASYLIRFRPKKSISTKYLRYYLQSPTYWRAIAAGKKGIAVQNVNATMLSKIPVPVAPESEQLEIVAEIEKQFSRLDEAVTNLKRVKANLKRYKASVLKDAVEGRLVPTEAELARREGRSFETGEQLLQRILEMRRCSWTGRGKYKEPIAQDATDIFVLPDGWSAASVEQLTCLVEYGSSAKTGEDSTGVLVLRMGNIVNGEFVFDVLKYLPVNHDEFPKLFVEPGDLLFNRTNSPELVGKTAVFKGAAHPFSYASYLIRLRVVEGYTPDFLAAFINSSHGREWVKRVVTQQVGQANVNGTKLQALRVPLPPSAEQGRIVSELERRMSLIRGVESEVDANLQRAQALRNATLNKAFSANQ